MSYRPIDEIYGYIKNIIKSQLCDYKEHKEGFEIDNVALNDTGKRYHFIPTTTFLSQNGNGWKELNIRGNLTLFRKAQRDVPDSIRKVTHDGYSLGVYISCDNDPSQRCENAGAGGIHRINVASIRTEQTPTNDNIVRVIVELDFFLTVSLKPTEG